MGCLLQCPKSTALPRCGHRASLGFWNPFPRSPPPPVSLILLPVCYPSAVSVTLLRKVSALLCFMISQLDTGYKLPTCGS